MLRALAVSAVCVAAVWVPVSGQRTVAPSPAAVPAGALAKADLAWERGDYVAALTTYLQILDSPDAGSALEAIALQTGELYRTTELTADGANPQFSRDGRYIAYETGPTLARLIRIVQTDTPDRVVAELHGSGAAFSPDGSNVAYLRLVPSRDLQAANAAFEAAPQAERQQRLQAVLQLAAAETEIVVRTVAGGEETTLATPSLRKQSLAFAADRLFFAGGPAATPGTQIYSLALTPGSQPVAVTSDAGDKVLGDVNATGTAVLFSFGRGGGVGRGAGGGGGDPAADPAPSAGAEAPTAAGGRGAGRGGGQPRFGIVTLPDAKPIVVNGAAPAFSGDGRSLVHVEREGAEQRLVLSPVTDPATGAVVRKGDARIDAPALSRDGSRIAFQMMTKDDWEIYVVNRDGRGETRVTRDLQHDIVPKFLTPERLLGAIGEPRHRRSFLYDLPSMTRTRLFHNNTVRTIAPEYSWTPSGDGTKVLIAAERDGNTVSPERGVYLVDLTRKVTRDEVRARVKTNLDAEQTLRAKGKRIFAPIAAGVRDVTEQVSVERIYGYEKALFDFDSKHVTQPGNKLAAAYLLGQYKSFGYDAQYQPFEFRGRGVAPVGQTANVVATLTGTINPELVYVVSSHYDSVAVGPGADDDSSGTAALLETARVLAGHPQPATIVFASFTGEEAGLLGSREFVRRAVADKVKVVGALNNDMVGWANDYRLDDTIRYSNPGIRDVQHSAAMNFSSLITYDALYYKSTDAAAYYDAYGDIVGGIGSYPVLSSPHYHQSHDLLDTINHRLVAEVAKTTVATLMLLASSPSRLKDLKVDRFAGGSATLSWTPSPETGVTGYLVSYGSPAKEIRVAKPAVTLTGVAPGTVVQIKAVNAKGLEGWDWARITVK